MPASSIMRNFFGPEATAARTLSLVLVASGAIIAIALGFEFIGGYRPCPLCLQQRYAYYLAILVGAVSLAAIRLGVRVTGTQRHGEERDVEVDLRPAEGGFGKGSRGWQGYYRNGK